MDPGTPTADIRIGYARCSSLTQELQSQLDALAGHGIPRDKIFSEKISTRVRVRPQFEAALTCAREIKAHAPHCRVIFTVYEMKRLGRDAAELTGKETRSCAPRLTGGHTRCTPARLTP
ncbi:recombinase family protein [Streptomyces poriferorum]|uniref:recombinase family protein n=1 Tax=Streptomyces poriferorum TaxID=2798799 RepID=UPI00273D6A7F|nr:recombinase family protein [Streptomyces sp. Alt4]MDP5317373.1 recombinase family protein [Streptomyces sp. Alt4]